ncbi:MAG TPA: ADP-glyceromanno-heptose 6-epimerase [Casimicrobiaceae bacterium]|nr:ADP-glyceromanno-heptose 6-epimerase [Casimicrobiaceae bacterium]
MYIIVTGAAGFIGSNLIKALNARSESQIIAVDNLQQADKFRNLVDCEIAEYFDQDEFSTRLAEGDFDDDIAAVLHQGACSDTMQTDGRYMLANNYRYSMVLLRHCQDNDVPFIYASSAAVYGAGREFREEPAAEAPLNVYGYSKLLFDQHVRRILPERTAQIAGFRYFNVYGPREAHKGRMASVVWHFFNQYRATGKVQLFEGSGGYAAGEQRRDFISVDDVIKVNLDFLDHPQRSGIFNVGTGSAASFNAVAAATINACRAADGAPPLSFHELHRTGAIEYIGFPAGLASRYQSFTQADLGRLRAAGYTAPMATIDQGVASYVRSLLAAPDVNPGPHSRVSGVRE